MKRLVLPFACLLLLIGTSCTQDAYVMNYEDEGLYEAIAAHGDVAGEDNLTEMESAIMDLVNAHREGMGLSSMQFSAVAYGEANKHNDYMIAQGKLSHDHFSKRAQNISEQVQVKQVSENVAKNYSAAQEVVNYWLGSPDHRRSMEASYTHTAVSVKVAEDGTIFFTQLFYR